MYESYAAGESCSWSHLQPAALQHFDGDKVRIGYDHLYQKV